MGMAEVHVSKAKLINDKLVDFSYWDGAEWQTDARKSQRIAGITKSVSEQFNVVELEEKIAEIVSRQEAACGITHILAPVLDISRDSRMGRQGETYGEDPALASAMGAAYTKGIQKKETAGRKTESVAKHFLAFHNSNGGIHGAVSDTPPRLLEEIYGKPFQAAIQESDLLGIMPCYCTVNGEPVSASYGLLTKLLRDEMGFQGLCISDYGAVGNTMAPSMLERRWKMADCSA